ncbi:Kunitz/Bovine pancreatic trypsin inhibitor domain protein, partial [Dictyocaulus viviparus]
IIKNVAEVCQPFQYRGCGGNSNRFETASECRDWCPGGKMPTTETPSAVAGSDAVFVPRGDSHDQWMKAIKCGSNYLIPNAKYILPNPLCPPHHRPQNGVCCPTKDFVCSLRDDSGQFADGIEDRPRFAWNQAIKSCERFSYFGANGNYNNFPNFYSCLNYCKSSSKLQT